MSTLLVVSPHLDDAVLSCGGAVHAHVRAGGRAVVATVFSEGREHARRRDEDRLALETLGATSLHLGLFDAPERLGLARTHCALVEDAELLPSDVAQVRDAVRTAVGRVQPAEIWAPLGVGDHIDHRVVHAALQERADVVLYEDRPYAFLVGAVRARLVQLGLHVARGASGPAEDAAARDLLNAPDRALVAEAVETLPHLRAYLSDAGDGARARAWLTARLATRAGATSAGAVVARVRSYDPETAAVVARAIGAYASQVDALFGGPSRVAPALRRVALALASGTSPALHVERTFTVVER